MPTRTLTTIFGQPSWHLKSDATELWLTRLGGQAGPVRFDVGGKWVEPMSVAPWGEEADVDAPAIVRVLRGDFFCMPFGDNSTPFNGERHPVHGETANEPWTLEASGDEGGERFVRVGMRTTVRPARVTKTIALRRGHTCVYNRHVIAEASGPMEFGHHAMVKFRSPGLIATSPFVHGQVLPQPVEDPAAGGYQALKIGAMFDRLDQVALANGGVTDLSRYPAREGFEDLAQIFADPALEFGWTTVSFPQEGYLWFGLKDPRVLTSTLMWISNGGRHYAPWSGRHRGVMGLEETTSYFHCGLAASVAENEASRRGLRTFVELDPQRPLVVNYIFGVVGTPAGFGAVDRVERVDGGAVFHSGERAVTAAVGWDWLDGR